MDNPEEYIRRDIEGSDVDTRRRAACDLVKVLSKYFEAKIMDIFGAYIQVNIIEKLLIVIFVFILYYQRYNIYAFLKFAHFFR